MTLCRGANGHKPIPSVKDANLPADELQVDESGIHASGQVWAPRRGGILNKKHAGNKENFLLY